MQAFAQRGAHIGLVARGKDGLEGAKRDVEAAGGKALVLPTDVADANQVEAAAAKIEQEFGPIDVWVNDAMISVFSPIKEMTADEFKRVTEVTYLGFVYGTMAAQYLKMDDNNARSMEQSGGRRRSCQASLMSSMGDGPRSSASK